MSLHWGVDSWNAADHTIRTPRRFVNAGEPREQTLFEYVTRRVREPEFWGRYLNRGRNCITPEERDYIFSASGGRCRIVLVYNGPHRRRADLTGPRAFQNGRDAALRAIALARGGSLNAPASTRIYADLERWLASPDWFHGWMETMARSQYPGIAVYGNVRVQGRVEGWREGFSRASSERADRSFRSFLSRLASGGSPTASVAHVWSNRPYLTRPGAEPRPDQLVQTSFRPERGPMDLLSETVIWQYGPNVPLHYRGPLVDLNVCTERGYAGMWAA